MDKMTFASYKFKPSDVIEGLNRYFAESKVFLCKVPLEIKNGTVKPGNYYVFRNIVFNAYVPKIKEYGYYYLICDPEEVVGVAINWLREEHDIFYTPGMEALGEGCDIFCEENLDVVPVAKVREALGIGEDSESDIFEWIAFLKKSNERSHSEMYKARGEKHEFENKISEALGTVDEYADLIGLVRKLKEERDELKEKCDKMKKRANAVYGTSCGYSGDKAPAFLCDVISYSWDFGVIDTPYRNIRVELELTPTANYKGTFDIEDLKKYIREYGREKRLSGTETLCDINDCIDELCDKYNIVQPVRSKTTRERLDYIFDALSDYREMHDSEWAWVEKLIKEKRTVEDSLAELRAKIREIYRSVVDDEWDESLSYTSAMNDINEEYKRVVHNFEERTVDWSKAQQELDRYARLRSNICTALCIGGETSDEDILERVRKTKECHDKLCKDYTKLHDDYIASQKQVKGFTNHCDSLENLRQDLWEFRKNAIEDLKNRGFFFRPEENETLPEIYDKLLKRYDDYFSRYKEQYRLRQCWHVRWESEHERANGEHKRAEKLKNDVKCWTKRCDSLQTALNNSQNDGVALQAFRNECKKLREEKTKVISALGQDIWDDCVK